MEATNQSLLKRVAEVQGRYLLAVRLLRALHLKVAHLQGLNESLQVRIAALQQQSAVQVSKQDADPFITIGHVCHQTAVACQQVAIEYHA